MTCEVCCWASAEKCPHDIDDDCGVIVCDACLPRHEREAHPPEPDYDYAMEQRRDDARRT